MNKNYPEEADLREPPISGFNNGYVDPNLNKIPYNYPPQQNFNNPQFNPNYINMPNNLNYNPNIPYNPNPQMNYQQSNFT